MMSEYFCWVPFQISAKKFPADLGQAFCVCFHFFQLCHGIWFFMIDQRMEEMKYFFIKLRNKTRVISMKKFFFILRYCDAKSMRLLNEQEHPFHCCRCKADFSIHNCKIKKN
jgi:hypothetical protein